jgi:hypothetical protein
VIWHKFGKKWKVTIAPADGQLAILESAEQVGSKVRYKTPKSGKGRTLAHSTSLVEEFARPSATTSGGASKGRCTAVRQHVRCGAG